jgi:hypothetical protein
MGSAANPFPFASALTDAGRAGPHAAKWRLDRPTFVTFDEEASRISDHQAS